MTIFKKNIINVLNNTLILKNNIHTYVKDGIITKTIFATFSPPKNKPRNVWEEQKYHIIDAMHFDDNNETYDFKEACNHLSYLKIRKVVLISITKNPSISGIRRYVYFSLDSSIIEYIVPVYYFWTIEGMKKLIFYKKNLAHGITNYSEDEILNLLDSDLNSAKFVVYKFDNATYTEIYLNFLLFNISISGSSGVKRHLPNPLFTILHIFLTSIYKERIIEKNWNSFFFIDRDSNRPIFDYNLSIDKLLFYKEKLENEHNTRLSLQEESKNWEIEYGTKHPNYNDYKYINMKILKDLVNLILELIKKKELEKTKEKEYKKLQKNKNMKTKLPIINGQKREYHSSAIKSNIIKYHSSVISIRSNVMKSIETKSYEISSSHIVYKTEYFHYGSTRYKFSVPSIVKQYSTLVTKNIKNKNNKKYSTLVTDTTKKESTLVTDTTTNKNTKKDLNINIYLNRIKEIINNPEYSPEQAQNLIESSWIEIIKKDLENDKILLNKHSQNLHYLLIEKNEMLDSFFNKKILKKKFPLFNRELNKIEYLLMAFSLGITLYNRYNYTNIIKTIGENIVFNIYKKRYKKEEKKSKDLDLELDFPNFNNWKENEFKNMDFNEEVIKIGDFFISILSNLPDNIFERKLSKKRGSKYFENAILTVNEEYLDEIKNNLIINPNTLPMICKPNEWSEESYGGFLSNEELNEDIITGVTHKHIMENRKSLYNAINYLNSIKFCINSSLLNFLSNEGNYLITEVPAENELQRDITLKVANAYKNIPFYLNCKADWRGRIYTESFFIDYQGSDLSSSFVNFYEGEPINDNGKYYLYIHGANQHNENNISRESFEKRIEWILNNYDKIINLDKELILSAENKFTFSAFCLNMKEIHNNPNAIINTPVVLDASVNGIQHLSAILQDLELGIKVNLVSENHPRDLYSELLDPINKAINSYGEDNTKYNSLSSVKLTRKIIKQSIMTKVYNVTVYGIREQIKSKLDILNDNEIPKLSDNLNTEIKNNLKKDDKFYICPGKFGVPVYLTEQDILKISQIINDQIFVLFPSLNKIYNYLIEITKLMITLDIPLTWITPSGLKITQHYVKTIKRANIAIRIGGRTKKIVLKQWTDILNEQKQRLAIIPNIIHSLDASHLINLINSNIKENFYPIVTVHDCFGTLPNKMNQLEFKVKKEFILLYTKEKFLKNFHKRIIQSIKDNNLTIIKENNNSYVQYFIGEEEILKLIPKVPTLGKLDLNNIINSKYMIN
jgi:DNA-dependent RNA polymerase